MSSGSNNTAPPKRPLSTSNVDNVVPPTATAPDPDTSFLEMVLEAHEATPSRGISVDRIRAFVGTRYQLPEPAISEMLPFTMKFAVESQLLVKVSGRKGDPLSWTTRLNPTFILILLRRVREEAKNLVGGARKRKAGEDGDGSVEGSSERKVARN